MAMFDRPEDRWGYESGWFVGSEGEDGSHRRDTTGWPYSIYRKAKEPGVIDAVLCHGIQDLQDAEDLCRLLSERRPA